MRTFRGWVPTITGNLSFAIIGQGRKPTRAFQCSRAFASTRHVIVAQRRRTTDTPFGCLGDLFNKIIGRVGWTVYIFFGKSIKRHAYKELSGPCVELTPKIYRQHEKLLNSLVLMNLPEVDFDVAFEETARKLSELRDLPGCGLSAIKLERDGKAEITIEDSLDEVQAQDVASQIFFFLRDMCHVHQHHAPTSDTILDVVPYKDAEDEAGWKRETLYALYRWVIQQKRSKSPEAYINAKGVLAYAKAFSEKHCIEKNEDVPKYLREATIESIDAGLHREEHREKTTPQLSSIIFNRVFPSLAIALAILTPFYKSPSEPDATRQEKLVAGFAQWTNENILTVFFSTVILIILTNLGFIFRSRILGSRFLFDLYRVAVSVRYWIIATTLFIATLSLLALAIQKYIAIAL